MLSVREIYCPSHFGNSFECASKSEMRDLLSEAKHWGFTRYSDWFDTIDLYDLYAKQERGESGFNMPEAVWRMKFSHFETAAALGFELGLSITPNHVFSDQLQLAENATKGKHVFGQLLCPSDTKAHDLILGNYEHIFQDFRSRGLVLKSLAAFAYDYGGCACEKCRPWIVTYGRLYLDIAKLAESIFGDIEINLVGWWWSEDDCQVFANWANAEAKERFDSMIFYLPYGKTSYDTAVCPLPVGCRERAFIHLGYSGVDSRDHYSHYGPVIAPKRITETVKFLGDRQAEGFQSYNEGTYEDVNRALLAGLSSGKYSTAEEVLIAYADRYFGNEPQKWADWLQQWETPWYVDVRVARRGFDRLASDSADSWRLEQWDSRLRLFEAHANVISIPEWNEERVQYAEDFWHEKEFLWREIYKLGLTRHIFKFDWFTPDWHSEYLEHKNQREETISLESNEDV